MINLCKKCGSKNLYLEPRIKGQDILTADMVALKCKDCGSWLKWCPKDERKYYFDKFDYGIVIYKHRFDINRSLNDYAESILKKCIRMGLVYKYKTMGRDKLIAEMQVLYRDENNKVQCLCLDLQDWTFKIQHKGDMLVEL